MVTIIFAALVSCAAQLAFAQEPSAAINTNPPIFMEAAAGNRALLYQMIIDKKLESVPKFGFFGVTYIQPEWGKPLVNDYMLQANATFRIIRGIELTSGLIWNPVDGVRPTGGVIFSYGNREFLAVVNPRIDLVKQANFDLLALVEYKPQLTENLQLYTRLQGLYTHNLGFDIHTRSYVMLRAGLTLKDITCGAAANFDWYGPQKFNQHNIGGFLAVNLF